MIAPDSFVKILRNAGVDNPCVIKAMCGVNREDFVEDGLKQYAWDDQTLPIGNGQTISLPSIVGIMTQALELNSKHKVLEIGTGCGYQTSVLSPLARNIYTIERHSTLAGRAKEKFKSMRLYNIFQQVSDGGMGFELQAPYDRIIVTCSAFDIPQELVKQLAVGGVMIVPVGQQDDDQDLLKIVKNENGIDVTSIGVVRFVPMVEGLGS